MGVRYVASAGVDGGNEENGAKGAEEGAEEGEGVWGW